jgi:glycosyltransferase involved in cell wall biosynthesis
MPEVSVIIPLYNKGPHIARAIQSILDQTEQSFEIIVVDGQSTDEGPKIVKSFKDQRIFFFEQEGTGVSSARNEGICHSRSDFIAFLDADDEWMPDHLETLLRLRKAYPEAGAYTTAHIRYPNFRIRMANFHAIPKKPWEGLLPSYFKSAAFGAPPVWTSVVGVPKWILTQLGGFSTDAWWGEDTDLWGRIALKYPIAFSWNGVGIYHTEASNRACNRTEPVEENIFVRTAREALEAGKVPPAMQEDLREYIAKKQIETAWLNIHAKRADLARTILKRCDTRQQVRKKFCAFFWAFVPSSVYELASTTRQIIMDNAYKTQENYANIRKPRKV